MYKYASVFFFWLDSDQLSIGEVCGDNSFLAMIAFEHNIMYKTWILQEPERKFVEATLWQSNLSKHF
jgi:hypothetical protein